MEVHYRHGDDHVHRLIAGEDLLIALRRTEVSPLFALSDTGAVLWEALGEWATVEQLVESLLAAFEVDADTARTDVHFFLDQLQSIKALQTREGVNASVGS